ncbi:MAG TPA: M23 family metallopeptidase [Pyrinomonadaceae bacterium]|nr:M23 family metallopeptidase [Pyrinomonadaceae bacterium]
MTRAQLIVVIVFLFVVNILLGLAVYQLRSANQLLQQELLRSSVEKMIAKESTPVPATPAPTLAATPALTPTALPASRVSAHNLIIPVAGVRPEDLQDTFSAARSEGRIHNAIDIMAARGTPVLAATDGKIVRLFENERGGLTLYQRGADEHTVYYYAHLDRYAEGLAEGQEVRRGDVIAYVGNTGNAGPDNYHLHFSIWKITDPNRFWDGENLNPYPLLRE